MKIGHIWVCHCTTELHFMHYLTLSLTSARTTYEMLQTNWWPRGLLLWDTSTLFWTTVGKRRNATLMAGWKQIPNVFPVGSLCSPNT